MKVIKKYILLVFCILFTVNYADAQSIKAAAEQKKQQQQYESEQRENELKARFKRVGWFSRQIRKIKAEA